MDPTLIQNLIEAVVLALVGVIAFFARQGILLLSKYIEEKIGAEKFGLLKDFAGTIVRSLEQSPVFAELAGEKKKELAMIQIVKFAESKNIPIDYDYLEKLIEEAVQVMNEGLK